MEPSLSAMKKKVVLVLLAGMLLTQVIMNWRTSRPRDMVLDKPVVGTLSGDWVLRYRAGLIKVDDPRRLLFTNNKAHPEFSLDHLMSAETQRLYRFIVQATEMAPETVWMLLQGCRDHQLSVWIVLALIDQETGGTFRGDLVGRHRDRGYMQITPITERHLFQQHGTTWHFDYNPDDIFEPWYNLTLGMQYLRELADRHVEPDWGRVLSEYNYGPAGLSRYYQATGTYETPYSRRVLEKSKRWESAYLQP